MKLTDTKAIVTGGVKGLGRAIVDTLLDNKAQVAVIDLDTHGLAALQAELPQVQVFTCDLTVPEQIHNTFGDLVQHFGIPQVLVNNAGFLYSSPLLSIGPQVKAHSPEMWDKVISANLSSVFYLTSFVVEKMVTSRTKGVVINISSVSSQGNAGQSAYAAAKAGVNSLTSVWAKELGPMGIRFVAVSPGYTDTLSTHEALNESTLKQIIKEIPVRRLGKPEEIAAGVLAVIENDFFNGKVIELDGGLIV